MKIPSLRPWNSIPCCPSSLPIPIRFISASAEDPVHRSTLLPDTWIVTRYADVAMILRDARCGRHDAEEFFRERFGQGPLLNVFTKWMLFRDPPDHTRLRTLVNKAFTPRAIEGLRPRIHDLVTLSPGCSAATGQHGYHGRPGVPPAGAGHL